MFAVMLLPFALLELPAGKIADRLLGEKELLAAGFIITAFFTALMSLTVAADIVFWTFILFMTRVGASLIEIMTESYFFKHVGGGDNTLIGFFRIMRPAAYIAGPLVGTIALVFVDFRFIFLILSAIVLLGLYYTSMIRDTR